MSDSKIHAPLNVLHLNTTDILGGAARAAYRLHTGLRNIGADSRMRVAIKAGEDASVLGPRTGADRFWGRLAPNLDALPRRLLATSSPHQISPAWLPDRVGEKVNALRADVINLHWICGGYLRPESLSRIKTPLVWTLHDMWAFCGGEHYVENHRRYLDGYLKNNRPADESGFDLNRWVWQRKLRAYSRLRNLTVVTPSRWLGRCARESVLFRKRKVEVIPYGLDHTYFKPMAHRTVREILGLPVDRKLVLFSASNPFTDPRKGLHLLVPALEILARRGGSKDTDFVILGSSKPMPAPVLPLTTHYMGSLQNETRLALVYAAADVFVAPSTIDNLPLTVQEAMACGTPAVGFDTGGLPDMIEHQRNGYLAAAFDTEELAAGIAWVLEDRERWQKLSRRAREKVEQEFTLDQQAKKYKALYEDILSHAV